VSRAFRLMPSMLTAVVDIDPAAERQAYDELCAYTLTHGNVAFIHQHVVDAWAAQHASASSKPIGVTFALAGLYLHVERGLTGRQVQLAHMRMARQKRSWPAFVLPEKRGEITAIDVMRAPEGEERDKAIDAWAESVWSAFAMNRPTVVALLAEYGY
jgi:Family of unknown function (DUF5946)